MFGVLNVKYKKVKKQFELRSICVTSNKIIFKKK